VELKVFLTLECVGGYYGYGQSIQMSPRAFAERKPWKAHDLIYAVVTINAGF